MAAEDSLPALRTVADRVNVAPASGALLLTEGATATRFGPLGGSGTGPLSLAEGVSTTSPGCSRARNRHRSNPQAQHQ